MCVLCDIYGSSFGALYHPAMPGGTGNGADLGPQRISGQTATAVGVGATGYNDIDGLLSGYKWSGTVTYSFPNAASDYTYGTEQNANGFAQISAAEQTAVIRAMGLVTGYTNLDIQKSDTDIANIQIAQSSAANPTAYAYYPGSGQGGDVWFGTSYDYTNPKLGDYYYLTHIHELGHAFGLKHSQSGGGVSNVAVPSAHDALEYTVMSYRSYVGGPTSGGYTNETYGYPTTFMMNDILALQTMYGADYNTQSGDTTYSWNPATGEWMINGVGQGQPGGAGAPASANRVFMTVWDGGGNDTYDMSNYATGVKIDLNPGAYSLTATGQLAYLGSSQYAHGNVYNAYLFNNDIRSYIENAIGGSGADTLTGNAVANRLDGRAGADSLTGGGAADTFVYGPGYGADVITDFTAGSGAGHDIVDISAFTGIGSLGGLNVTQSGANAIINFGSGNTLTLNNVTVGSLTAADFIFGAPPPAPTGAPPTNVNLTNSSVLESASVGAVIGTLAGVDNVDANETYTYSLVDSAGGKFSINGANLVLAAALSYETAPSYNITVRATDSGNQIYDKVLTINVGDVAPGAPADANSATNTVVEGAANGTLVGVTASASDVNGGSVTYSLLDSAGGRFAINASTGVVTVADGSLLSNAAAASHQITVQASDGTLATTSNFTIAVTTVPGVTITGNINANTITGGNGADTLNGAGGNDTIYGLGGNDVINGGNGNDKMYGGAGNDAYIVNTASDMVTENAGEGTTDTVQSSVTYTLGANVENLVLTGTGSTNGTGNDLANSIVGNTGNNILAGLGGADILDGVSGTDTATYAVSNAAVDVSLMTGLGHGGHAEGDTLANIDNLTGSIYGDTLEGNAGTNVLDGGAGIDTLTYAHAAAGVKVSLALTAAQATVGAGSDTVLNFENLTGSAFADTLTGTTGNNIIDGLAGVDSLTGGGGSDTFRFAAGYGADTITDFIAVAGAGHDVIDISAITTIGAVSGLNITQVGANALINFGNGDTLTLNNVTVGTLTADDFIFGAPPPPPTGAVPTNITLSNSSVLESAAVGAVIGALAGVDNVDASETYTYSLLDNAGGRFTINGANLVLASALNYESGSSYQIDVQVTDSGNQTYHKLMAINVGDVAPTTPADADSTANTVQENSATGALVGITASATDINGGAVTYTLTDDAGGRFAINATTGVVTVADGSLLDDAVASSHQISVQASDGTLAVSTNFTIAVTNVPGVTITGNDNNNNLSGGNGDDTIDGGAGNDTLYGLGGNDFLKGGLGADKIYGGLGQDILTGIGGNDFLAGEGGVDTLTGGVGADAFHFNSVTEGGDTITDFTSGSDWLSISAAGFGGGLVVGGAVTLATVADFTAASGGAGGYFIFDTSGPDAGTVYWDANGGSGSDAVALASLGASALLPSDFHVI